MKQAQRVQRIRTDLKNAIRSRVRPNGNRTQLGLELNEGCSTKCPFCCHQQTKDVKNPMNPDYWKAAIDTAVENGLILLVLGTNSEPLDYDYFGINVKDVVDYALEKGIYVVLTTSVPKGKEQLFLELLEKTGNDFTIRLSFSFMNERRLLKLPEFRKILEEAKIEKQEVPAIVRFYEFLPRGITRETFASQIAVPGTLFYADFLPFNRKLPEGTRTVSNSLVLANLFKSGKLKDKDVFVFSTWVADDSFVKDVRISSGLSIVLRNWHIDSEGKFYVDGVEKKQFSYSNRIFFGPESDEIYTILSVPASYENNGLGYRRVPYSANL